MRQPDAARRGKTLIEMVAIIGVLSVMITIAGQMLFRLSRSERLARDGSEIARAEMRLARLFRADARSASSASRIEESGLRFETPAGVVSYQLEGERIRRSVEQAGKTSGDAFRLGAVAVTFLLEENDRMAVIGVEPLRQISATPHAAAGPLRIVAAVGADRPPEQEAPQ